MVYKFLIQRAVFDLVCSLSCPIISFKYVSFIMTVYEESTFGAEWKRLASPLNHPYFLCSLKSQQCEDGLLQVCDANILNIFTSKFTWIYFPLTNKFTDRSYLITMIEYAVKFEDVKCLCYQAFRAHIDGNPLNSVIMILIEQMSTVLLMSV